VILAALAGVVAALNASHAQFGAAPIPELDRHLEVFQDAIQHVGKDFVDRVDEELFIKGATEGMLGALYPHSARLDALHFSRTRGGQARPVQW